MNKFQKFKIMLLLSIFYFLFSAPLASAARLYFEPQEQVIGTEDEFSVAVKIDAEEAINTISAAILVSKNLVPQDINEANSIISFWVDKPNFDEASRLLTFSGIIPGGFQSRNGNLLIINLETRRREQKTETAILSFDKKNTKVYLHTSDGIEDSLMLEDIKLPIVQGKKNVGVEITDYEPPETFTPDVFRDPNVFSGKWILVFATQDKGSGMHHYEVQENRKQKTENRKWIEAESSYALKDQRLKSYIYVKAVDKAGNERIAVVAPRYPLKWYENYENWIMITILIIVAVVLFWLWKKNKKFKSRY